MTTSQPPKETARHGSTGYGIVIPGVEVVRHGRVEPFLHARPTLTSTAAQWAGLALEGFSVPACVIPRHEHIENFLHVVLSGPVKYEVLTRGQAISFVAVPGTTFLLPRATVIEAGVDAGFKNPSQFARMFRKFVGVSPSRFKFDRTH